MRIRIRILKGRRKSNMKKKKNIVLKIKHRKLIMMVITGRNGK